MFLFILPPNNTGNLLNHKKCGSWRCASSEGGEWNRSVKCNERKASQFAASIVKQKRKLIMFPVERTHLLLLISDEHRLHCVSIFSSSADWWVSSKSFCIRTQRHIFTESSMSTEAPLSPSPPRECNNAMTLGLAATTEGYAAENVFRWRRGQKRLENCLKSFSLRPFSARSSDSLWDFSAAFNTYTFCGRRAS